MFVFIPFVIAACAVWIYVDATEHRIGKIPNENGFFNLSAGGWALFALLLWFIGIPCYLINRRELILKAKEFPVGVTGRTWKMIAMQAAIAALAFFSIGLMIKSWAPSKADIATSNEANSSSGDNSTGNAAGAGYSVDANGLVNSIEKIVASNRQSVSKPISSPDFNSMTDVEKNTCLQQINMYIQMAAAQASYKGEARAQEEALQLINENASAQCREYATYMHHKYGDAGPAPAAVVESAARLKSRSDAQVNNILEAYRKALQKQGM